MTIWRYTAIPLRGNPVDRRKGETTGETASEVRAALRRVGLQVIRLKAVRRQERETGDVSSGWHRHLRRRRRGQTAELYDGLATMLEAGLPLLEAVDTMIRSGTTTGRSGARSMLNDVRETLRDGASLADAMHAHPTWFDTTEVAMIRAAQLGGTLPRVLRTVAERQHEAGELSHRLITALTYPAVIALVGIGVVVFLSVRTLPELVKILAVSGIETPTLTARVMAVGSFLYLRWWIIALAIAISLVGYTILRGATIRYGVTPPRWFVRLTPRLFRRVAVARVSLQLAELVRTGVPIVDALRVLEPTIPSIVLRARLRAAANRAESGEELSAALDDDLWFDAEFRRLLDIGQTTGQLDELLERIGERYTRQSRRLIDRLATLLEPAVIVALAFLVGLVVIAALLPLLRIREIL